MSDVALVGIHHVKFPVSDLARSRAWYEQLFALTPSMEFPDADGVVRGVAYETIAGSVAICLRENAEAAGGTPVSTRSASPSPTGPPPRPGWPSSTSWASTTRR